MNETTSLPVLDVNLGAKIELGGRLYVVTSHIDLDVILCKEVASGAQVVLKLGELNTPRRADPIAQGQGVQRDLQAISTQQWAEAQQRRQAADAILAKQGKHGSAFYKQLAAENGVSVPTLYRWASDYRASG